MATIDGLVQACDFNGDRDCGVADADLLVTELARGGAADGIVSANDLEALCGAGDMENGGGLNGCERPLRTKRNNGSSEVFGVAVHSVTKDGVAKRLANSGWNPR